MEQEPGASGVSMIDTYRREVLAEYDFAGVRPNGSKESRAHPVLVRVEQGQVLLALGSWNDALVDELCGFPYGNHDDQVDALSGAYHQLATGQRSRARMSRLVIRRY